MCQWRIGNAVRRHRLAAGLVAVGIGGWLWRQ